MFSASAPSQEERGNAMEELELFNEQMQAQASKWKSADPRESLFPADRFFFGIVFCCCVFLEARKSIPPNLAEWRSQVPFQNRFG